MVSAGKASSSSLFKRVLRFGAVGASCFALSMGILSLVTKVLGWHYLIALTISILVSNCLGFALNRCWTFEASGKFWPQLGRYYMVNSGTYVLNFALTTFFVGVLHLGLLPASSIVAVLLAGLGFVLHGRWSFGSLSAPKAASGALN